MKVLSIGRCGRVHKGEEEAVTPFFLALGDGPETLVLRDNGPNALPTLYAVIREPFGSQIASHIEDILIRAGEIADTREGASA